MQEVQCTYGTLSMQGTEHTATEAQNTNERLFLHLQSNFKNII